MLDEAHIRADAIRFVRELRDRWVAIPASEFRAFSSGGQRIHLKGQQGIFKPAGLSEPLSITTTLASPYTDDPINGTRVLYNFAPQSREHENDGLKRCAEVGLPVIYFLQVKEKPQPEYIVFAPVFVVAADSVRRQFLIDLSESPRVGGESDEQQSNLLARFQPTPAEISVIAKSYALTTVQRRLHQARFRNAILNAYRERCAVCILHIRPLLDGAHVIPDRDPKPTIVINEGLALCAIHHRAFDANVLKFDSQYRIRVDLPEKTAVGDGERSMLLAFDGKPLTLPKDLSLWPVLKAY